jgi:hypothetical protein
MVESKQGAVRSLFLGKTIALVGKLNRQRKGPAGARV